ncbi:MAG: hypothetical protein LBT44_06785 [Clostridiales bacterium]|jgi:hypothetical protein|nr:hypothetical protein [Clostridiales bacterium]
MSKSHAFGAKKKISPLRAAVRALVCFFAVILAAVSLLLVLAYSATNAVMKTDSAEQQLWLDSLRSNPGAPVNEQSFADFSLETANPKINEVRLVSSHNSYRRDMIEPISTVFHAFVPNRIDFQYVYEKPHLSEQLDSGVRGLELDVHVEKDSIRVYHLYPFDAHTNGNDWLLALEELKIWSDNNPNHFPLMVCVEFKNTAAFFNPKYLKDKTEAVRRLNDSFAEIFGEDDLILPKDVLGEYSNMAEAVNAGNWPTYQQTKGKILFYANLGIEDELIQIDPTQKTLNMFISAEITADASTGSLSKNAAIAIIDGMSTDAMAQRTKGYVDVGYLVRQGGNVYTGEKDGKIIFHEDRVEQLYASQAQLYNTDLLECAITPKMDFWLTYQGKYLALVS